RVVLRQHSNLTNCRFWLCQDTSSSICHCRYEQAQIELLKCLSALNPKLDVDILNLSLCFVRLTLLVTLGRLCEVCCILQNLQMCEVPERASDGKASRAIWR